MTNELICYKQMPVWTKDKLPKMFQEKHNTKVGTWGKLTVLKGKLKFYELTEDGDIIAEHIFTPESNSSIPAFSGLYLYFHLIYKHFFHPYLIECILVKH